MTDDRTFAPREDDGANAPDESLERLVKADPAATVEAGETFAADVVARAAADPTKEATPAEVVAAGIASTGIASTGIASTEVAAATASEPSAPEADDDGETPAVLDLTAARDRRRPRWYQAAAAAAVAGLVGVGGYAIGAQNDTVLLAEGDAAAPISLSGGSSAADSAGGSTEMAGGADKAVANYARDSRSMLYPGFYGHRTFSSSGLSTAARTALGYAFDSSSVTTATVDSLAAAFGVAGTTELRDGMWVVGPQDGSASNVGVSLDGSLNFYFSNPAINPWSCGVIEPATVEGSEGGDDAATSDIAIDPCTPTTPAPSEEVAIEALRNVLVSIGRDPAGYEFTSETWENSPTRSAQAWLVVDGQRTDHSISVEVAEAGIVSAYGPLATLVSLGEYPVVSEQEAFDRLSDPRFGANQTYWPMDDLARADQGTVWTPPTAPPTTPSAGTAVAWPVNNVEITGARLGLASQYQADGTVLIVPAYEFTAADGGTWSVIAVADGSLDFTPQS